MPIKLTRTTSSHPDFIALVRELDADLAIRDGDDHPFYAQYNKIDAIKYVIVAHENEEAVGCGAIKEFEAGIVEVKRMFTAVTARKKGIASMILSELEKWASELGYHKCILETGINQNEAIGLYPRNGYQLTENYGQYAGVEKSLCFEKLLLKTP